MKKEISEIIQSARTEEINDYYTANKDFGNVRVVKDGHEVVDYRHSSLHRIWMNEQPFGFAPHWHSAMEMIIPVENNYTAVINDVTYEVQPAEILIIPPGVLHELQAPPTGRRFIFIMNISSFTKLTSFSRIMAILSQPLLLSEEKNPEVYGDIYTILLQIRNEYFGQGEFSDLTIQSLLLKMFVCLGENYDHQENVFYGAAPSKRKEYVELFNDTLRYIDEHFTEELSLENIAFKTGFSKFHFSRLFKQYTNYNFSDYLCFRRIKEAETLLMQPDMSITDVAISSGFSSISTFNRLFKQHKGCSPSDYRRRNSGLLKKGTQIRA